MHTKLAVLGGGPGGYAAAFRAADLGIETTIVDQESRLGGVCLLRGCIPSKALLHAAGVVDAAREADQWGIHFDPPRIDAAALRQRTVKVISTLTGGLAMLAKQRKVRVINARGEFIDAATLRLSGGDRATYSEDVLTFDNCIVAGGSRPSAPKALSLGDPRVMDSDGALELGEVPPTLLVVGGGYIGLELGSVYANLGSKVTVVEMTDGLLSGVDRDLVKPLQRRLEKLFDKILLGTTVTAIQPQGPPNGPLLITMTSQGSQSSQQFDRVLVSVGRRPNSDGMGLERAGVKVDEGGFVVVDPQRRTSQRQVFAVGDIAGQPMLAHKAFAEGKVAAEAIAGRDAAFEPRAIPAVVFTDPEVAWAGVTEDQAKLEGRPVEITRYPWAASGRAQGIGRTEGLTKLIFEPQTGQVIGGGIVGYGAGELIAQVVDAIEMGATAGDLALCIHPHPTMSETLAGAADLFLGSATEMYRPKKG